MMCVMNSSDSSADISCVDSSSTWLGQIPSNVSMAKAANATMPSTATVDAAIVTLRSMNSV